MKSLIFLAALAAFGTPASLGRSESAQNAPRAAQKGLEQGATLDSADRKFINDAALDGMLEVKLGQMATKQAANEEVKKFGQRMVDDHTKMNSDLTKLAGQKGVTIPQMLDKKHQDKVDKLAKLGGVDFDKEYMKEMVDDHESTVKGFEKAAKDAKDPDVKSFAAAAIPKLQEHHSTAKDIHSRVKQEKKP
jgi:putative membrane protein